MYAKPCRLSCTNKSAFLCRGRPVFSSSCRDELPIVSYATPALSYILTFMPADFVSPRLPKSIHPLPTKRRNKQRHGFVLDTDLACLLVHACLQHGDGIDIFLAHFPRKSHNIRVQLSFDSITIRLTADSMSATRQRVTNHGSSL